jgi:polyisoprenoid-binding protein YceI
MKHLFFLILFVPLSNLSRAQYKPGDNGSSVNFIIRNFGFNTGGSFHGLKGEINFNAKDLNQAIMNVSVDAGTINTDNELRDEHLRQESYFDVKDYPRISFVSTKISGTDKPGHLYITGNLSIKNKIKEISFPFIARAIGDGYLFNGEFTIDRKDFNIGSISTISDSLQVQLRVLATK